MAAIREAERIISQELEKELWSYAGKWVVLTPTELIAVGETPQEAIEAAKEKHGALEGLLLHHVPKDEGRLYFL